MNIKIKNVDKNKIAAWAVHGFTASGAVLGFLALISIFNNDQVGSFLWLGLALLVDGLDGTIARKVDVTNKVPNIDGSTLDNLIDYLNYVIIPSLMIYWFQMVPNGWEIIIPAGMFAGNITVPIIVAGVFGQTPEQKIFLIQMALFVAGVATLIQTIGIGKIGSKLPIIQGTSFGFIPVMLPFKAFGLGAIFGAALIGGIFQMFLGYVLKPIRHMFPPLVTGIVVLMIGVSLLGVGFQYAGVGVLGY